MAELPLSYEEVKAEICRMLTEGYEEPYGPEKFFLDKFMNLKSGSAVFIVKAVDYPDEGMPFWATREEGKIKIKNVPEMLRPYLL